MGGDTGGGSWLVRALINKLVGNFSSFAEGDVGFGGNRIILVSYDVLILHQSPILHVRLRNRAEAREREKELLSTLDDLHHDGIVLLSTQYIHRSFRLVVVLAHDAVGCRSGHALLQDIRTARH